MNATRNKITIRQIMYAKPNGSNRTKREIRQGAMRPYLIFGSGLAVLALVLGLAHIDQMMAQNWLMMPLE